MDARLRCLQKPSVQCQCNSTRLTIEKRSIGRIASYFCRQPSITGKAKALKNSCGGFGGAMDAA